MKPNFFPIVRKAGDAVESFLKRRPWLLAKARAFSAWYVGTWGHRKYGLFVDDIIDASHPVVQEAILRLPEKEQFERTFRIRRAIHLHMRHETLPRAQWTTPDQDRKYLWPYVEKICAERDERAALSDISSQAEARTMLDTLLQKRATN